MTKGLLAAAVQLRGPRTFPGTACPGPCDNSMPPLPQACGKRVFFANRNLKEKLNVDRCVPTVVAPTCRSHRYRGCKLESWITRRYGVTQAGRNADRICRQCCQGAWLAKCAREVLEDWTSGGVTCWTVVKRSGRGWCSFNGVFFCANMFTLLRVRSRVNRTRRKKKHECVQSR